MLEIALLTICVLIIIIYFINSYEKFENTNSFEKIKEISVTPDLSISNVNSLVEKAFTEILFNFENKRYILKNLFQVILLQNGTLRFTALLIDQDAKTEISVDVVFSSDYTKILDMKLTPYVDTTKPGYTPNCLAPFSVLPKDDLILTDQLYSAYQEELKKQSEKSYLCFGTQYNDLITKEFVNEFNSKLLILPKKIINNKRYQIVKKENDIYENCFNKGYEFFKKTNLKMFNWLLLIKKI